MNKVFKKLYNIFLKIIVVFLIIVLIYILYSRYIAKNSITKIFGYGFLVVLTGSMEPEIEAGELVIIKESEYKVNDVITYEKEGVLITHRVIENYEDKYICKGDSNNENDLKITENQIQGKVVYHSKILRSIYKSIFKNIFNNFYYFYNSN